MLNLIFGFHSIDSYLNNNPELIHTIYIDKNSKNSRLQIILNQAKTKNIQVMLVDSKKLDQMAINTKHQGIIAEIFQKNKSNLTLNQVLEDLKDKSNLLFLILDGITDPHNLGAILRTAECFAVDAVIIPKHNSANADSAIVTKSSSGAINHINLITVNNLNQAIEKLKEHQFWIAGTNLSDKSISLFDFKHTGNLAWVLGSEGSGLRRLVTENCDYLVSIPMLGQTQSLNVSVAAGIILSYSRFELKNQNAKTSKS